MLYLVIAEIDNCESYEDHMWWTDVMGITDSLETGKRWIIEEKERQEEECKASKEKRLKVFPDETFDFGIFNYEESKENGELHIRWHSVLDTFQEEECDFYVRKIELNEKI